MQHARFCDVVGSDENQVLVDCILQCLPSMLTSEKKQEQEDSSSRKGQVDSYSGKASLSLRFSSSSTLCSSLLVLYIVGITLTQRILHSPNSPRVP